MWAGSKVVGTSLNKFLAKSRLCFPSVFTISAHYCLGVWYRPSPNSMQGATYSQNYAVEYCQMLKWNLLLKEINGCCHRHRYVKAHSEFKQRRFWATRVNRKWVFFFSFNLPWCSGWRASLRNREIKIHVYAKQQTWICTTWLSFPLIFRLLFIASTQK